MKKKMSRFVSYFVIVLSCVVFTNCSSERLKNQAKESAARYWQDKAYPGKAYDVQVVEAEKAEGGLYRVRGIVDGETRVGTFNPETETFSEGYYSLAHERNKRIAELEQELKYWKEKAEGYEKEIYKLKVRMEMTQGRSETKPESQENDKAANKVTDKAPDKASVKALENAAEKAAEKSSEKAAEKTSMPK